MTPLDAARNREKEARRHGRSIKLEQELNLIGLSLFAPPLSETRLVMGNEWEGHFLPEYRSELQHLFDQLATELSDIAALSLGEILQKHCDAAINKLTEICLYISAVSEERNKMSETESDNKIVPPELIDRWIEQFRVFCEAMNVEQSSGNKEFVALERVYWMGILNGQEVTAESKELPRELHTLLYVYRSPLLDYKSPLKKRQRRTKAQMEADQSALPSEAEPKESADA
jgi:hypothetical protein